MIAVISHDAGGAEIISNYIAQENLKLECIFSLSGPAINVFHKNLGALDNVSYQIAVDNCEWVLCGTSWQSEIEWNAIKYSRKKKKRSIAFIDHWVNYNERFIRNNIEVLPDEIWVGDLYAEDLARRKFPSIVIRLLKNPYILSVRSELEKIKNNEVNYLSKGINILYVCEPVAEHMLLQHGDERFLGYTEHDALHYFLDNINIFGKNISDIVVRPHPSECDALKKYKWAFNSFNIKLGGKLSLLEEIIKSDIVVGCESMAMVVGLEANKRVISSIPPNGVTCKLPHTEITQLSNIINYSIAL